MSDRRPSQAFRGSTLSLGDATRRNRSNPNNVFRDRVVVAMVGLPARGKSYLSKAIVRYLSFLGCPTRLFNAGSKRRDAGLAGTGAAFFDPKNADGARLRNELAMECLDELLEWMYRSSRQGGCCCGIFDATNTTVARRAQIIARCAEHTRSRDKHLKLVFVESLADDPQLLEENYRMKLDNADYAGQDPQRALADFRERVAAYEAVYEPITDAEEGVNYIQLINAGQKLISKGVQGFVLRRVQRLLGSVHLWPRTIWIALCGETESDVEGVLGGDPDLSPAGVEYSRALCRLLRERGGRDGGGAAAGRCRREGDGDLLVLTGTHRRYLAMADMLCDDRERDDDGDGDGDAGCDCGDRDGEAATQVLAAAFANDLCAGDLDSLTAAERRDRFAAEATARHRDKLNYRYPGPGGESYQDLIARCNELVCLLEQSRGTSLVICNAAVYRVLMGYFFGHTFKDIPHLEVKPGVLELKRSATGFSRTQLEVPVGKATTSVGFRCAS